MKRPFLSVTVKMRLTSLTWTLMVVMGSSLAEGGGCWERGVRLRCAGAPGAGTGVLLWRRLAVAAGAGGWGRGRGRRVARLSRARARAASTSGEREKSQRAQTRHTVRFD